MHGFLKQSTAMQARLIGPFIDDTDFKTLKTALTIANTDVKLSKNGAAGVNKNAGGGTHRNNGMYSLTFNATDTNTVGEIAGSISVAGALVVVFKFTVLEEVIYNAMFALNAAAFDANHRVDVGKWLGTAVATPTVAGVPKVDMTHMAGGVQTVTDLKDFADTGYDPATNKVQGVVLVDTTTINTDMVSAAPTAVAIADQVWTRTTRTLSSFGTLVADIWGYSTRTLTGFSTSLALSVWDVLEAQILTTGSVGLKVRNNLNATITSRSSHADPDPNSYIDAPISSRSFHGDPDPSGFIDAPISSRSSHGDPDPGGLIDVAVSSRGDATLANQTTILNRLGNFAGTGLNTLKGFMQALFRKDAGVSGANLPSDINEIENGTAGNYDPATDSLESLSDSGGGGPTVQDIDAELTVNHGAGGWSAGGSVVLPVMQGGVYSAIAIQNETVRIVRGDTPRITFDLGANYTGWDAYFGAKEEKSDSVYTISPVQCIWSDATKGQGYKDLTSIDTQTVGRFCGEIELRNGVQRLTAIQYTLEILEDVID